MPKHLWAFPLTVGLLVPMWAYVAAAESLPVVPVELNETVAEKPAVKKTVVATLQTDVSASQAAANTADEQKLDEVVSTLTADKAEKAEETDAPDTDGEKTAEADEGEEMAKEKAEAAQKTDMKADVKAEESPVPAPTYEALPTEGPIVSVPEFLGLTPYVTTREDVEAKYGEHARFYEDKRLGKRHIITGADFGIEAQSVLVSYTVDGLVSDIYVRLSADKRDELLERFKTMSAIMDTTGIWVREADRDLWVTKKAVMSVSRAKNDGNFSVEYGAAARKAVETRAWLRESPEDRCPHFSGLLVGGSDLDEVKKRIAGVKDCDMGDPILLSDGSQTYTLRGACFGIPGEVKSYVWFGADSGKLTRLEILSEGDPVGFESVLPALKKRFRAIDEAGLFETEHAPARNVWSPRIRFDAAGGKLEFWVEIDGIKRAEAAYDEYVIQKKAREAQAKRVDSLFD